MHRLKKPLVHFGVSQYEFFEKRDDYFDKIWWEIQSRNREKDEVSSVESKKEKLSTS